MKVRIQEQESIKQVEVIILCREQTALVNRMAKRIEQLAFYIIARNGNRTEQLSLEDIYYFESVENRTYIYCKEKVYTCDMRLYELEEKLKGTAFQRISKSGILNLDKMKSVKGQINGRLMVFLDNNEKIIVNRSYVLKVREHIQSL